MYRKDRNSRVAVVPLGRQLSSKAAGAFAPPALEAIMFLWNSCRLSGGSRRLRRLGVIDSAVGVTAGQGVGSHAKDCAAAAGAGP